MGRQRHRWLHLVVSVGLVVGTGLAGAWSARAAQSESVAPTRAEGALKARVENRFQVVTLRRGIVLVPKETQPSFANIEISDDGAVLIDGAPVTGRELRSRVGGSADLVAQLSFLDADRRRALFAPAPPAVPPPVPAGPGASAAGTPEPPPEPAETAQPKDEGGRRERDRRRGGARVRVGGDVRVDEGDVAGDAVVAVLGSARVNGRVDGDVVAVGGDVRLGATADVHGNVIAVGGDVERQPGARVSGDVTEVKVGFPSPGQWWRIRSPWPDWPWFDGGFRPSTDLFASLLRMALIGLLAAMFAAVAATPVRRISYAIAAEPWRAGLAGLAAQVFFVPVLVISVVVLTVSIIGIPLLALVPFALLAGLVALVLGFTGASCAVGSLITRRLGGERLTLLATLVVGLAVVWALTAVARFGGLAGDPVRALFAIVLFAGFVLEYVAWTVGLGGVLLTRFGRRGETAPPTPAADDFAFVDRDGSR